MNKVIKWGIVGAGHIANKFAKAVKNVKGAELTAVASQSEGKGRMFADKYDIKNVQVEVYNTKGFEKEETKYYSLSEIQDLNI